MANSKPAAKGSSPAEMTEFDYRKAKSNSFWHNTWKHRAYLVMALPAVIIMFLFNYVPMTGLVLAFKKYDMTKGIYGSPWNGLQNFKFLLASKSTFLNMTKKEKITAVLPYKEDKKDRFLLSVTKNGTIKKTALSEFDSVRKTGLIALTLKDGDELVSIQLSGGKDTVLILTKQGKCISFSEEDVIIALQDSLRDMRRVHASRIEKEPHTDRDGQGIWEENGNGRVQDPGKGR